MVDLLFKSHLKHPKNVHVEGEDSDEHVLYVFRRSFITNFDWLFISALLILTPFVANLIFITAGETVHALISPFFAFTLNVFWYLFTFGFVFQNFLIWFFNLYIITNKRIIDIDFVGLLYKNISETSLENIEDVTSTISGTFSVMFNYGDVYIQTAGERREFEFTNVSNPSYVRDIVADIVVKVKEDN